MSLVSTSPWTSEHLGCPRRTDDEGLRRPGSIPSSLSSSRLTSSSSYRCRSRVTSPKDHRGPRRTNFTSKGRSTSVDGLQLRTVVRTIVPPRCRGTVTLQGRSVRTDVGRYIGLDLVKSTFFSTLVSRRGTGRRGEFPSFTIHPVPNSSWRNLGIEGRVF